MSKIGRELVLLTLQFLNEQGFKESAHRLECESGYYFNMKHFEDMVLAGKWDDAEGYLSGFTRFDHNKYSTKTFFELRKHKFLQALDGGDRAKALDILVKDLKVFSPGYEDLFKEMAHLLTLDNIRDNKSLSTYESNSVRKNLIDNLKILIDANPMFQWKLEFPVMKSKRLPHLINQSLNWQHKLCKSGVAVPDIKTILVDHVCESSQQRQAESHSFENSNTNVSTTETAVVDPHVVESPPEASIEVTSAIEIDLPENVGHTLEEDSLPTSMDFHPFYSTLLLVGTDVGTIGLWDVNSGIKLFSKNFQVWDIEACGANFKDKVAQENNTSISVKRIAWSPDGSLFGVAFSEHIVQLYSFGIGNTISQHLEIDAHDGSVNDLAFSSRSRQLLVITCGDDKKIKVCDAVSGTKRYTFEGHDASVCSICPHVKQNRHFLISTSIDGKIKLWLYDTRGARVDFDGPCYGHTTLVYSDDDQRLFSCGSGNDGEPYLLEWDDTEGFIKRRYEGLKTPCFSTIQFDSAQNRILAAGDDHKVKFWDMDKDELWTSIDADGELLESPCIRFNNVGALLAVSAKENKIKIIANNDGLLLMLTESHSVHAPGAVLLETLGKVLQLPVHSKLNKIERLAYTRAGNGILALASNGNQVLWKWRKNGLNVEGKETALISPQIWQTKDGLKFMSNDLTRVNTEDQVSSFAISKNDAYLISTSGGIISLFNLVTLKVLTTFMPPPPMATCIAFCPQNNNIIAVGTVNSSVLIYNVQRAEVLRKLKGHSKRVTALAFSSNFNILVSGDADGQITVWNSDNWEKKKDWFLQKCGEKVPEVVYETHVHFKKDQALFLAAHHTVLTIYETKELKCVSQLISEVAIYQATLSSDGKIAYASLADGTLAIADALNLQMHYCRVYLSAYLSPSLRIYPVAIAVNPDKSNQLAVGFADGRVYVFEPRKPGGGWSSCFALGDDKEPESTIAVGVSNEQGQKKESV